MSADMPEANAAHWKGTRGLTILVLVLLAVFAFGVHWYAAWLNTFNLLGFPLGHLMAVQGSLAAFVALVFFHNWRQDEIDDAHGQGDE